MFSHINSKHNLLIVIMLCFSMLRESWTVAGSGGRQSMMQVVLRAQAILFHFNYFR